MRKTPAPFLFASAPDSWGVLDYPGPSWRQSYEKMLDEMMEAGYEGTELGPYGFFPTDSQTIGAELDKRGLKLLGSFVPVRLADPDSAAMMVKRIRKVGDLLAALKAPFLVLADDQSPERNVFSGRAHEKDCPTLDARQWKHVTGMVESAAEVASEFGLDLVFHPHVATYVETPRECERFFDATANSGIGLCLDTGHCFYGQGDPVAEAEKYQSILRFIHIKDCDLRILEAARQRRWTFEEAIEAGVFTVIGEGDIDFPGFFRVLRGNHYSGWMVVEQDVKFGAEKIPPAESVSASLRYLRGVADRTDS